MSKKPKELQCSVKCPYFPDMTCESYSITPDGVKYRNPPKVFRCCFDNHPINWYTPCPLKLMGGNNQLESVKMPEGYYTEYELEHRENKKKMQSI